jgi:hypothetical protein
VVPGGTDDAPASRLSPAWLAKDFTAYRGDSQGPAFIKKIRELSSQGLDWPRTIRDNEGYFEVL